MGRSDDKVIGIDAHRTLRQQNEETPPRTRQDAASSLSLALLGLLAGDGVVAAAVRHARKLTRPTLIIRGRSPIRPRWL